MPFRTAKSFFVVAIVLAAGTFVFAQGDNRSGSGFGKPDDDIHPKGFNESMEKMRIDKEKKEFDEMMERGEQAVKISEQVEDSFEKTGHLSEKDAAQIAALEKLARKIRSELGGEDDDEDDPPNSGSLALADAVKTLRSSVGTLYDELKKTTRFSISAAAIQSSNAVIRLAKSLKFPR